MSTKKRFVLSGYFGFKNFGDEAILSVLVNKLQQYKHRITVISSDPKYTIGKFKHIRSVYTFKIPDIIGAIAKSDFLISGGGSLLQDATSLKSLIYYLFIIFIGLVKFSNLTPSSWASLISISSAGISFIVLL